MLALIASYWPDILSAYPAQASIALTLLGLYVALYPPGGKKRRTIFAVTFGAVGVLACFISLRQHHIARLAANAENSWQKGVILTQQKIVEGTAQVARREANTDADVRALGPMIKRLSLAMGSGQNSPRMGGAT